MKGLFIACILFVIFKNDFLAVVFLYFMTVIFSYLAIYNGSSGVTPAYIMILLSGGMLVFLVFCALIFNCKINYSYKHVIILYLVPTLMLESFRPQHAIEISSFYENLSFTNMMMATALLICFSVYNLEVVSRS
uniref:NADH dehydrogenase subunit 6 n=1 Tax=Ihlea magalhanica TaxID=2781116 RepID=A0AA86M988_9UROC|nr:NADH dehydrogenase subunit 6 [Ihlea magalhanica]